MVFDMTSTQQASHDYLYPELTNASISVEIRFTADLAANRYCSWGRDHQLSTSNRRKKSRKTVRLKLELRLKND